MVVTLNQAVYAKAQNILWRHKPSLRNVVARLGSFHTSMTFMAVIGKRFSDAGLRDVLTESEIVSSGSVGGVIKGKHYNRAIRAHKYIAEALLRMQWRLFEAWLDDKMPTDVNLAELSSMLKHLRSESSLQSAEVLIENGSFKALHKSHQQFSKRDQTLMAAFWQSYIDMVMLLL